MAIDDQVAIMGSGNMDTQTWFHSQVRKCILMCIFVSIYAKMFNRKLIR